LVAAVVVETPMRTPLNPDGPEFPENPENPENPDIPLNAPENPLWPL
jgi:hypothetical protein